MLLIFLMLLIVLRLRKLKQKITGQTEKDETEHVEIMVPLKRLSNFQRTPEMQLIICEINLILTWFANCFIVTGTTANQVPTFAITDTKLYVSVVTLLNRDNSKPLQQLKAGFPITINQNKYQQKVIIERQNQYLDQSIYQNFLVVSRLFIL